MSPSSHTFPEIKVVLVTFDMMPRSDEGVMRMVRYDISRLKGVTKQKRAMSVCDAYRVWRSEKEVRVEFLDTSKPDEKRVRFRWIYELMPPFA